MLLPIGTNVQTVRRVPYVTFSLMLINALVCIYTSWVPAPGDAHFYRVKQAIIEVSAYYPAVEVHGDAQAVIAEAQKKFPEFYEKAAHPDENSAREVPPLVAYVQSGQITAEDAMDRLSARLREAEHESFSWKFAFHSYRPTPLSLLTSTFLHGGLLHLLGNMWFLYLTGAILEANWGHWLFGLVYMVGGMAALFAQSIAQPSSFVFVLGASGAVAACMGAFLVRFPNVQVKLVWILIWMRYNVSISALYILPAWLLLEIAYAFFNPGSIAHWAHIGGFVFGVTAAFLIQKTGLEEFVNREDERETWRPDAAVLHAVQSIEEERYAEAAELMRAYIRRCPKSLDGYETLLRAQQALEDKEGERETLGILCRLNMQNGSVAEVWQRYEEWLNAGGGPLEPAIWIDLCRYLEREKAYDRAVEECHRLAEAHPKEKKAFDALLMAGRISLDKLQKPANARQSFLAAQKCEAKDLAMEGVIEAGLKRCSQGAVNASAK